MAKNKNIVLISFLALGAISAQATDVWWQTSNPLSDVLNTSTSTGYQVASTSGAQSWWSAGSASLSSSQLSVASTGGSSWSNWGTTAVAAQTPALADDLFRNYLYSGSSGASTAVSNSNSWWNSSGNDASLSSTSGQGVGASWNSWNSSSSNSSSSYAVSGGSSSWWNGGGSWNSVSSSTTPSTGGWWNSWGGNNGGSVSSDSAACNMVSTWAGASSWREQWSNPGATPTPVASTGTCNQAQSSTINNLAPTTNLVPTNAPIGGGGEVTIDDFATPEPQTWMMMLGGLALLQYRRKRKVPGQPVK